MSMSLYDDSEMASDKASEDLKNNPPKVGMFNRIRVNASDLAYKCTFGKCGTPKTQQPACPYGK